MQTAQNFLHIAKHLVASLLAAKLANFVVRAQNYWRPLRSKLILAFATKVTIQKRTRNEIRTTRKTTVRTPVLFDSLVKPTTRLELETYQCV